MNCYLTSIATLSFLLVAASSSAETPEWIGKRRPVLAAKTLHGNGTWKTAGVQRRGLQRWSLQVVRAEGGEVSGTVAINDSPLLTNGYLRGRIAGDLVSGSIAGAEGNEVIRFSGTVRGRTLRGTFVDRTGETGEWVWDGMLPE